MFSKKNICLPTERILSAQMDIIPDVVWAITMPDRRKFLDFKALVFADANSAVENLWGYTREELLGKNIKTILTEQSYQDAQELFAAELDKGGDIDPNRYLYIDMQTRHKENFLIEVATMIKILYDQNKKIIGFYGTTRDITVRKIKERKLYEYEKLVENSKDFIFSLGADGALNYCNRSTLRLTGYKKEEIDGRKFYDFISPEHKKRVIAYYAAKLVANEEPYQIEFPIMRKDGREIWVSMKSSVRFDADGKITTFEVIGRDVSDLKRIEKNMNSVLENIRDGFYKLDLQGNIVDFNGSLSRILGYAAEDLQGLNYRKLTSDYYAFYTELNFSMVFREKRSIDNLHWKLVRGDGKEIYVSSSISPVFDEDGEVVSFQGILRDTSDVLEKVYQDAMTGLYNYRYLRERMKQDFTSIFERRTTAEKNAAVLFLDGNNLKKINDMFGHDCGDAIIKKVAEILKDTVRKTDTAARVGGDEFIIYLPDIDGGVEKVIKRIIKEVDEIPYGLSIGCRIINFASEVADNTDVEHIVEGVIKDADDAMYTIKENSSFKEIIFNNWKLEIKNSGYKTVGKKEVYVDNRDVQGFLF